MAEKGQKGCLVVHGLTGTPANMNCIAEALKARGYIVKTPLLAGHGVDLKELAASTWEDWYGTVVRAHDELSREVKNVYYAGISMGALLGMKLAEDLGNSVKALALLGVPFKLRPLFRYLVIPGVRYTFLRFFITTTAKNFEKSVLDPEGRDFYRQNSFSRMPSLSVFQTQDLERVVKKNLSKIHQPLILLHGRSDHLADPKGMMEIKKQVSSQQVDIAILEHSAHVLTLDYDRKEVAKRVADFFDSFANG